MKNQYESLEAEYQKDKQFYEEALEARMNQLEELETDNASFNRKIEDSR